MDEPMRAEHQSTREGRNEGGESVAPLESGTGIDGHNLAAWVIVTTNRRGHARYRPQVDRCFVGWYVQWRGRRRRTFDAAKAKALTMLHRHYECKGERSGRI